jgi:hypothetical protein
MVDIGDGHWEFLRAVEVGVGMFPYSPLNRTSLLSLLRKFSPAEEIFSTSFFSLGDPARAARLLNRAADKVFTTR